MSKKAKQRELRKKLLKIGGIIVVLLAAVGAGALFFWLQNQNKTSESPSGNTNVSPISGLEDRTPPSIKEAKDLAIKGNIDESNKKLDEALRQSSSSEDKYNIYLQQGINYANQKNYQKALDTLKLADGQQQMAPCNKLMGDMALLLGKKADAKIYYEKALTLLDDKSPLYPAEKRRLEDKIKEVSA